MERRERRYGFANAFENEMISTWQTFLLLWPSSFHWPFFCRLRCNENEHKTCRAWKKHKIIYALVSWELTTSLYSFLFFHFFQYCSNNERRFLRFMNEPTWTLNTDCYYPETSFALRTSFLSHFDRILHLICFVFYFQLDLIDFFSRSAIDHLVHILYDSHL